MSVVNNATASLWEMKEEQLSKLFCGKFFPVASRLFRKVSHNFKLKREWYYCCGTDIDILELTKDNLIIGYELKGYRRRDAVLTGWCPFRDAVGVTVSVNQ